MIRSRTLALAAAFLATAGAACAPAEAPPATAGPVVDTAAAVAGVAELWTKWAVADTADDLDGVLALMAEDGRIDIKGFPPLIGREGARAVMAPLYAQVNYLEASVTPQMTVAISNELVHQTGTYMERYTMKGQAGEMTDYARYAAAIVKGGDGQWRWQYMMGIVDSTVTKK